MARVSRRQDAEVRASGNPSQDEKEVLLGQYSSLSPVSNSSLTHNQHHPFKNKM